MSPVRACAFGRPCSTDDRDDLIFDDERSNEQVMAASTDEPKPPHDPPWAPAVVLRGVVDRKTKLFTPASPKRPER
jgi:hypothetical protein